MVGKKLIKTIYIKKNIYMSKIYLHSKQKIEDLNEITIYLYDIETEGREIICIN